MGWRHKKSAWIFEYLMCLVTFLVSIPKTDDKICPAFTSILPRLVNNRDGKNSRLKFQLFGLGLFGPELRFGIWLENWVFVLLAEIWRVAAVYVVVVVIAESVASAADVHCVFVEDGCIDVYTLAVLNLGHCCPRRVFEPSLKNNQNKATKNLQ